MLRGNLHGKCRGTNYCVGYVLCKSRLFTQSIDAGSTRTRLARHRDDHGRGRVIPARRRFHPIGNAYRPVIEPPEQRRRSSGLRRDLTRQSLGALWSVARVNSRRRLSGGTEAQLRKAGQRRGALSPRVPASSARPCPTVQSPATNLQSSVLSPDPAERCGTHPAMRQASYPRSPLRHNPHYSSTASLPQKEQAHTQMQHRDHTAQHQHLQAAAPLTPVLLCSHPCGRSRCRRGRCAPGSPRRSRSPRRAPSSSRWRRCKARRRT